MLPARPMLREQARPVSRIAEHLGAAGMLLGVDLAARPDSGHSSHALLDEPRPGVRARDTELPYVLVPRAAPADAAITQVETEQIRIVGRRFRERRRWRAPRTERAWIDIERMLAPVAQCRP